MDIQWKSEWTVPSVVGVISFGVGVGVGYAIRSYRERKLVRSFDEIMEEVEEKKKLAESVAEIVEEDLAHQDIVIDRSEHPSVRSYTIPAPEPDPEMAILHDLVSIFPNIEEQEDDWDWQAELEVRTPDAPYVIHRTEYEAVTDDDGISYSKSTLTYYQGDDVLVDDQDVPIYNYEKTASPLTFGKGSQDPSIVYIRNERLEADYEVLLDHGHYAVEVLGAEIEQKFENHKTPLPKFREE